MTLPEDRYCTICKVFCTSYKNKAEHLSGKRHLRRLRLLQNNQLLLQSCVDKNFIEVTSATGSFTYEGKPNAKVEVQLLVKNQSQDKVITLDRAMLVEKLKKKDISVVNGEQTIHIKAGDTHTAKVEFQIAHLGLRAHPIAFHFELGTVEEFCILKVLEFRITKGDKAGNTRPEKPFSRANVKTTIHPNQFSRHYHAGLPMEKSRIRLEMVVRINPYDISDTFRKFFVNNFKDSADLNENEKNRLVFEKKLMFAPLIPITHWAKFYQLLHMEELATECQLRLYDQTNVYLKRCPKDSRLFVLSVGNLAESRPSVLAGDSVFVRKTGDVKPFAVEGKIHKVELDDIWVGFNPKICTMFNPVEKTPLDVVFKINRMNFRIEHRAVENAKKIPEVVFPSPHKAADISELSDIKFYNEKIQGNKEQNQAVCCILQAKMRPSPYLLFGPPGTGKSVVVVESILQILKRDGKAKILACAPSNSAADLLVERLCNVLPASDICRLNALSRDLRGISASVLKCSCIQDGESYLPNKAYLIERSVIVATLATASRLVSAGLKKGYFDYIFIDEAGQATEPQSLIAVAGLYHQTLSKGLVVLAGDPQQLGPVVQSDRAKDKGLAISWLERLMTNCPLYKKLETTGHFNPHVLTKLLQNYRSHPKILEIPNELFYDNELLPKADPSITDGLLSWSELPRPNFPLIFHGTCGEELQERHSPSFFNPIEIEIIQDYVDKLLLNGIQPKNVGIISPYKRQVQKLTSLLSESKYVGITIGSVEQFQGSERQVVLISTVRSDFDYLHVDAQFRLGFLNNPKRFNTACTRAKALLIVVGNPFVLSTDPNWKRLIEFCSNNGAYRGSPFNPDNNEYEENLEALSNMLQDLVIP